MRTCIFFLTLLICSLAPTTAKADVIFISGANSPAEENVLFNQPGLIQTGTTVQGRAEPSGLILNFTFADFPLNTTSPGEPRIDMPGRVFNSLRFEFDDPAASFTELDFAIHADQVGFITFTAITTDGEVFTGTSTLDAPFINPFSVLATDGQRLREVSYVSPAPYTVDVRRIRVGGVAAQPIPEPATMLLLGTGLAGVGGMIKRRHQGKEK